MAAIEIVRASGKAYCRGGGTDCICWSSGNPVQGKIPKGYKALKISIYDAGGSATAFYCCKCMGSLLRDMEQALKDA